MLAWSKFIFVEDMVLILIRILTGNLCIFLSVENDPYVCLILAILLPVAQTALDYDSVAFESKFSTRAILEMLVDADGLLV